MFAFFFIKEAFHLLQGDIPDLHVFPKNVFFAVSSALVQLKYKSAFAASALNPLPWIIVPEV